jgi:hypothetical protein
MQFFIKHESSLKARVFLAPQQSTIGLFQGKPMVKQEQFPAKLLRAELLLVE